jgi:hypothetical protein
MKILLLAATLSMLIGLIVYECCEIALELMWRYGL